MKTLIALLIAGIGVIALTGCGHPKITQTPHDEHYRPLASWVLAESAEPSDAANSRGVVTPVRVDQSQPGVVHIAYSEPDDAEYLYGAVHGDQISFRQGVVGPLSKAEAAWSNKTEALDFDRPDAPRIPGAMCVLWVKGYDLVPPPAGVETGGRRVFWLAYFGDLPEDGSSFDLVLAEKPAGRFVPLVLEERSEAAFTSQEGGRAVAFEGIDSALRLRLVPAEEYDDSTLPDFPAGLSLRRVPIPPLGETDNLLLRWMREQGFHPYLEETPRWEEWGGVHWLYPPEPWPGMGSARPLDPDSIDAKFDFGRPGPTWSDDDQSPGFRTLRTMR